MAVRYGEKKKVGLTAEQKLAQRNDNIKRYRESIGKSKAKDRPVQGTGLDSLKDYVPKSGKAKPQKKLKSAEEAVESLRGKNGRNGLPRKRFN